MIYEHWGDNRSGKSALNALFAWFAYLSGQRVYCNCPVNPLNGKYLCIPNFPHFHLEASEFFDKGIELTNCYIWTDQGEQSLESLHITKLVKEAYYFGLQATKRGVDWHYDTVLHGSIMKRIRKNAHFYVQTVRIPPDPRKPLKAIRVSITSRYSSIPKHFYVTKPQTLFPLYNSDVLVVPKRQPLPPIDQIHKALVAP